MASLHLHDCLLKGPHLLIGSTTLNFYNNFDRWYFLTLILLKWIIIRYWFSFDRTGQTGMIYIKQKKDKKLTPAATDQVWLVTCVRVAGCKMLVVWLAGGTATKFLVVVVPGTFLSRSRNQKEGRRRTEYVLHVPVMSWSLATPTYLVP